VHCIEVLRDDQIEKQRGRPPSSAETNDWISQITAFRISQWRENAARAFDAAARAYMHDHIIQAQQGIIDNHVVNTLDNHFTEVRRSLDKIEQDGSFGKQIFIGFLGAILSPVILGLIILAIQAADLWPTPSGLSKFFHPSQEAPPHSGTMQKP